MYVCVFVCVWKNFAHTTCRRNVVCVRDDEQNNNNRTWNTFKPLFGCFVWWIAYIHGRTSQQYTQSDWVACVSRAKTPHNLLTYWLTRLVSCRVVLLYLFYSCCFLLLFDYVCVSRVAFHVHLCIYKTNFMVYIPFRFFLYSLFVWICSKNECANTRAHCSKSKKKKSTQTFFDRIKSR